MAGIWKCAAGLAGKRRKNRLQGIMSDCTGRSSPMISNWVGKVTWGINGVTGEAWLTATRYLWDIGSMWISRWESATLEDRTRSTSLWTVTMYGRPLKTAAGSARPRRRFRSYGSWAVATTTGRKEAGSDTDTLLSGVPIFMDGTDGL